MDERLNIKENLQLILSTLPEKPGVYQYFDKDGKIIYVGKAKNLKKRVSSYFTKKHDSPKVSVLVKQIATLKYIVVDTEEDALLLENNLIKEHQPRYNIMLKDDKSYPWLCITNEPFPRVFKTRKIFKNGARYFGPFSSLSTLHVLLSFIGEIYPLRTCKLNLSDENIKSGKFKVCLQYHIHKCKGPCEGLQSEAEYLQMISEVAEIANGNVNAISTYLQNQMQALAAELKFEEAQIIKEKYAAIENYKSKSIVTTLTQDDYDVFAYDEDDKSAYINILRISKGSIIQGYTIEYTKRLDEPKEEILAMAIVELRTKLKSRTKQLLVPFLPDLELANVTCSIPSRGDKKKLLDLSMQNVREYKLEKLKQAEKLNPDHRMMRILNTLQKDLKMSNLPMHIECFDNSNIQGTNPVAACVVFKKAKPAKKDYRHFNIKTVEGPNDFASMEEVVYRRYRRMLDEGTPLPQLVVIDGGKGQLGMAMSALRQLDISARITVIGIAKRLEEIYFAEDPIPLYLDKNSESLKLIQQLRDEAHRFGITHHRNRRSKAQVSSELDSIPGIGEKSKKELLTHFKSVKRLRLASNDEITEIVGSKRASIIYKHFHPDLSL
ncbi:excinuclease ABC subunit UvrC [Paludibacter sp.]|uniref:excinuclease ABC subunit UvrC n=1 Tax=Paludibacter sp. TaxID=1898105 RepID=UPI00135380BA|nr:excinuclease ABC subunit UvrC [Paludibacter sp.]MTK53799.1 excinuclease ABC subunit UvrC [Paludibacter sp.]